MEVAQQQWWRKRHKGGRVGSFAPLDYVGPVSKTQLKAGVNVHKMLRNLDFKAGGCQDADTILITETQT